jgi:hypothetical protein
MDRNRNKVSKEDAKRWALIGDIINASQGDPFEASRKVSALLAHELEKARMLDKIEGALKELKKGVDCVSDALSKEAS